MKITATRVNGNDELEYTVVPTVEERNWMAVYANLCGNLCDCDMDIVDRFAARAWDWDQGRCTAFVRLLNAWLGKLEEVGSERLKRMYGAVLTYDEAEWLLAYRNMVSTFNMEQLDELRHVMASVKRYHPEACDLMLGVMAGAEELLDRGAGYLRVTGE